MEEAKHNLMLVDDEIMVIKALMRILDKTKYNIYYTIDPLQAIEILSATRMDIIICDQSMPNMTGLELCVKTMESQPSAIRILMSGNLDQNIDINAVKEGLIYSCIRKPWDNSEFIAILNDSINRLQ
jgi:DNA-binding NtrC family response regulator